MGRRNRKGPARHPAFLAEPGGVAATRPTRRQTGVLLAVLILVAGAVAGVSALVRPDRARSFDLFQGSLLLADAVAPVSVDLATGRPTIRLIDAGAQVGATNAAEVGVTALRHGTLLFDRVTGEFNVVAQTGFVTKTDGGVPIVRRAGATATSAVASGDLAYLVQSGTTGASVYLVGQATVDSARNSRARVRPRAFASLPQPVATATGTLAAADGSLWVLAGPADGTRTVRQLQVPSGSSTGATLTSATRGRVSGPGALAANGNRVGTASSDRIQLFSARTGAPAGVARFATVPGLDQVLPVASPSSRDGARLTFLLHGSSGWQLVSVRADGTGRRGPTALADVPRDARLAPPVQGGSSRDDDLYTLDRGTGALYRIAAGTGVTQPVTLADGTTRYPLARQGGSVVEASGFSDAYLVSRGPRIVVNSPSHLDALVLFTDGSHPPRTLAKSAAVAVNAASGVESLTRSRLAQGPAATTPQSAAPKPKAQSPVNNKIDCRTTRQQPHLPTIVEAVPGARSVLLSWTYPLLSPQDCAPSTYVVGVRALSAGAPGAPSDVRVQGQQSVNLAGLYPSTRYAVTVTAYLNGVGTESAEQLITTGPEGPTAPRQVRATVGSDGAWQVSWASCGAASGSCVPASTWRVVPQFCDGLGLSGAPATVSVTADPTSVTQPGATVSGGDALLGRGLQFQVEGVGEQGTVGDPSATTACTTSWAPPVAADLSLHASTAPLGDLNGTTTATVTLDTGGDPVRAVGGAGATIRYVLAADGAAERTVGPTSDTTATFDGIGLARRYQVRAIVTPPGHPEAAVTVGPVDVQVASAPWPALSARVTSVDDRSDPTRAKVSVQLSGLSSAAARGETFELVDSELRCGNAAIPLEQAGFDPADPISVTVDRTRNLYGSCTVRLQLAQFPGTATKPPLFGDGTVSGVAVTPAFTIAAPSLPDLGDVTVTAAWDGSSDGRSLVAIRTDSPLASYGRDFAATVAAPDGTTCGGYSGSDTLHDVAVDQACVGSQGSAGTGWTVTVTHATYAGADRGPYTANGISGGQAPTYAPPVCDVSAAGLSAHWSGSAAHPSVTVEASDAGKLANCGSWVVTDAAPQNSSCGTASGDPPPVTVPTSCPDTPAAGTWQVQLQYSGTDGSTQPPVTLPVGGDPPS